ncbi:MFS transporter [Nakamurella endophytica]|nr:MFS transporter [Nakamurella endophytica]
MSQRWLVLVAMTGSLSMILLDQTVVTVALPSMSRELGLSAGGEQWVVNAYVLAMAALVALGGKLGDRLGGVTTFRIGVTVFFLASLACGFAPATDLGEAWIIAARVLQGAGAALMTPVSAALVIGAFSVAERGRAMAVYAGISQVFLAVGPLLGGVLTEAVSWRTVFWLNVPVGVAALVLVHVAHPADVRTDGARITAAPVAGLVLGVAATVLAVQQAGTWGWTSPATAGLLAVGLVLLGAFVVAQLRSPSPLVDVRLLGRRAFLADVVVLGLVQFGLLAVILYSSIYLQVLLGMSPMLAGVCALPLIVAIAAAAQLGGRWYDAAGVRPPVLTGVLVGTAGLLAWAVSLPTLGYGAQVPGMVLTGLGIGLLMSPTNTDALGRVDAADRSQASGIVQTVRQLGGTLGVAVIGAVVLGAEGGPGAGGRPQHAADAITLGFFCAAAAFVLALVAGTALLSRERLTVDPSAGPAPAAVG